MMKKKEKPRSGVVDRLHRLDEFIKEASWFCNGPEKKILGEILLKHALILTGEKEILNKEKNLRSYMHITPKIRQ
jgi:hypothetical protein